MFDGVKNFLLKKALAAKMKDVPEAQREQFLAMMEKNPGLFEKIGKEVEEKKKAGMDEFMATMSVMQKYKGELQKLVQGK